ncbi:unnamed protein product, partial [Brenthis ino]
MRHSSTNIARQNSKMLLKFSIIVAILLLGMTKGEKNGFCICPLNENPVCGSNGRTYGDVRCLGNCHPEVKVIKRGPCPGYIYH